ncbi:unnamed protein product [Orchesella dallaii]|uniref:Uncharacterized protein n=1 Tax=Orchesella dallaii TaxID=48710 RepID=A0ABP1Q2W4_9HEXA
MACIGIFVAVQTPLPGFLGGLPFLAGMMSAWCQFFWAFFLVSQIEKKEIDHCKYWMSATILTSITYVICIAPGFFHLSRARSDTYFSVFGCVFIAVFTSFKACELTAVYAFIKEVERYWTPITPVASVGSPPAQSQIVSPYAVATNLNTSGAPQSHVVLPQVVATDVAPSCPETQNQPSCVEPFPPYSAEQSTRIETDYIVPEILTPDLPPSYNETQRRNECGEPPPSYEEVISSK